MSTTRDLTVVMADPGFEGALPGGPRTSVLSLAAAAALDVRESGANYFIFASASELEPVARLVHEANSIHRLRALFVRADVDCTWFLPMFERANLRTLRNTLVHTSPVIPQRVVNAWRIGAQDGLIADAIVADDRLIVRSCALDSYELSFDAVPALARLPRSERQRFTVDPDGSFLHWECGDTHVGLETIRFALDPAFREAARLQRLAFDRRFGGAVKAVRVAQGLRQSDIPGLSARQVSRIESGSGVPRCDTLAKMAAAHALSVSAYLDRIAEGL
ncbi:MAG: hypothetical protein Q7W30_02495 [Coriobacteriia bacterium]|nr:hypothetical protein [Coriobacteriia bacterium]